MVTLAKGLTAVALGFLFLLAVRILPKFDPEGGTSMLLSRKKNVFWILFCLSIVIVDGAFAEEANTTWQIITHIDDVLKANPLPAGKTSQLIPIAQDDTISAYIVRMMPGAELGPHYHQEHDEIEYVIRGKAQLLINDQWADIRPGSIHFNPMQKVHAARNTGNEPLIVLIAFTPAMKETDRHFLK